MNFLPVQTSPPAKLNVFLELLGKRVDGYHDLETVMVAINRRDRLVVRATPEAGITMRLGFAPAFASWHNRYADAVGAHEANKQASPLPVDEQLPTDERNLVVRALGLFNRVVEIECGYNVQLEKGIPFGAGMGGASSDAASALLAAAKIHGISTSDPRLWEMAEQLGSDVPFFLGSRSHDAMGARIGDISAMSCMWEQPRFPHSCSSAIAKGRGEQLEVTGLCGNWYFVVVHPPTALSTARVYGKSQCPEEAVSSQRVTTALAQGNRRVLAGAMVNRLMEPAMALSEWVGRVLAALQQAGLEGVTMTGSGSACFGIARTASVARRAGKMMAARRWGICFTATPTSLPAPVRLLA